MIVATISTLSYLNRAKVMAKSIKKHHPDAVVILCLAERELLEDIDGNHYFDKVILPKDLDILNLDGSIFKYNHHEASIYLKGELLNYLFKTYTSHENIVYIDADIKVYSPLVEMLDALKEHSIVFTPHMLFKPHPDYYTAYLWYGFINAGFIGFRRTKNAKRFVQWWADKLEHYCYVDKEKFIQLSQAWAKLAPTFFEVYLLRHPGYNVAFWNLHERKIDLVKRDEFLVNGIPLRFFHYSSLNGALTDYVKASTSKDLKTLFDLYVKELNEMTIPHLQNKPWSYSHFQNGTRIENKTRELYRGNIELQKDYPSPFRFSNSFFEQKLLELSRKDQDQSRRENNQ